MLRICRYVTPIGVGLLMIPSHALCEGDSAGNSKPTVDLSSLYDDLKRDRNRPKKLVIEEVTELERFVSKCRGEIAPIKDAVVGTSNKIVSTTKGTACSFFRQIDYIQKEAPPEIKIGSIAASGLVGMLMGLRRGLFRKLIYGLVWSASAGAIIYPGDAKIVAERSYNFTKTYSALAYNFIVGAKPSNTETDKDKKK